MTTVTLKGSKGSLAVGMFFLVAFILGSLVGAAVYKALSPVAIPEKHVTSAGYGVRNMKYGSVSHSWDHSREAAERFNRKMNSDNYVDQTPPEYEVVEVFYRRVK